MSGVQKEVTVIMPALNEEANIKSAITHVQEALETYKIDGEIIIVDDGSCDKTGELIREKIQESPGCIRVIEHETPKGIGVSFWEGVDEASGDAVVMLPGDDENDPAEIFRYRKLLEHVDIVIPFIFNREVRPLFRNILSFLYRVIINTTFRVNFHYTNGTVLYRTSILKELRYRSSGFFFQTDILVRSAKMDYLFAEVPYRLKRRKKGVSKAISFPSLRNVVGGYLRLVRDYYFRRHRKEGAEHYSENSLTSQRRKVQDGDLA